MGWKLESENKRVGMFSDQTCPGLSFFLPYPIKQVNNHPHVKRYMACHPDFFFQVILSDNRRDRSIYTTDVDRSILELYALSMELQGIKWMLLTCWSLQQAAWPIQLGLPGRALKTETVLPMEKKKYSISTGACIAGRLEGQSWARRIKARG
jgi:hypothetical protein